MPLVEPLDCDDDSPDLAGEDLPDSSGAALLDSDAGGTLDFAAPLELLEPQPLARATIKAALRSSAGNVRSLDIAVTVARAAVVVDVVVASVVLRDAGRAMPARVVDGVPSVVVVVVVRASRERAHRPRHAERKPDGHEGHTTAKRRSTEQHGAPLCALGAESFWVRHDRRRP
jgi:hypothetical protein